MNISKVNCEYSFRIFRNGTNFPNEYPIHQEMGIEYLKEYSKFE